MARRRWRWYKGARLADELNPPFNLDRTEYSLYKTGTRGTTVLSGYTEYHTSMKTAVPKRLDARIRLGCVRAAESYSAQP